LLSNPEDRTWVFQGFNSVNNVSHDMRLNPVSDYPFPVQATNGGNLLPGGIPADLMMGKAVGVRQILYQWM
jgi:hypothetical protein